MRNGIYDIVKAPDEYPGRTYRGALRLIQEHHLVWWRETGTVVPMGYVLHHKNGLTRDNRFENLELKTRGAHTSEHNRERLKVPTVHGTESAYVNRKCRCEPCRLAHNVRCRVWKKTYLAKKNRS